MPTGYTAGVADGTVADFPTFAMLCARAFGALITMRDEPFDAAIPEVIEPSTYHARAAGEARRRLAELRAMSEEDAGVEADLAHAEAVRRWESSIARTDGEQRRYQAMMAEVIGWNAPTPDHEGLKEFMLEQLRISAHGDDWRPERPQSVDGRTWLQTEIDRAERNIEYHDAEQAKENERASGRTEWIRQLRESLAEVSS